MIKLISSKYNENSPSEELIALGEFDIHISNKEELLEWLKDRTYIELDTETIKNFNDFSGKVFTFQVGDYDTQFVIDCTEDENIEICKYILNMDCIKILQNAKYDIKWFLKWGINPTNIYDTMLAEMLIHLGYKDVGYGLDIISDRYLNHTISKTIRGHINYLGLVPSVIDYAAGDVKYLNKIKEKQLEIVEKKDLSKILDIENRVVRVFAEMEYNGIGIDSKKWLEVEAFHKNNLKKIKKEIDSYLINADYYKFIHNTLDMFEGMVLHINYNSSQQVVSLLNNIGRVLKDKALMQLSSVSEKELSLLAYKDKFIQLYLNYKKEITLIDKYGSKFLKFINPHTGRVHCDYWQMVETGRVSCKEPNIQQSPTGTQHRQCFIPSEGYIFIAADYGSQELVLIAEDSKEPVWIDALNKKQDLHSVTAAMVFKQKWKDAALKDCQYYINKQKCKCPEHKVMRDKIKTINYALSYGAGINKIASNLVISPNEAKAIINEYFNTFKSLKLNFDTLGIFGKTYLFIRTFWRRIRNFRPPENDTELDSIRRQAMNTRYQGSGADMMKLALCEAYEQLKPVYKDDVRFLLQVHDEILIEVKKEIAEEVNEKLVQIMKDAGNSMLKLVKIDVESKISVLWEH
jgi:DNA polymerase I-like protein with 3'-5' exonuclease and polymerase domains